MLKATRNEEVKRRLAIERARVNEEAKLRYLPEKEISRLQEEHLSSIKNKVNAARQEERNQGYKTDNGNISETNYTSDPYNDTSNYSSRASKRQSSKTSSEPVNRPVNSQVYNSNKFGNMRERARALIAEKEAAEAAEASRQASMAVSKPQSWRNYIGQKIGW
jgi:hypothetical protein